MNKKEISKAFKTNSRIILSWHLLRLELIKEQWEKWLWMRGKQYQKLWFSRRKEKKWKTFTFILLLVINKIQINWNYDIDTK